MDIAIVGAGTVGTAVGVAWARAGHRVVAVTGREATVARAQTWLPGCARSADRGRRDRRRGRCDRCARRRALPRPSRDVAAVDRARRLGAASVRRSGTRACSSRSRQLVRIRLALHPLQTFADVAGAIEALAGCAVAVTAADEEGAQLGERSGPRPRRPAVPAGRRAASAVSRGRRVRVELPGRDLRRRRRALRARGRARRVGGDASAAGGDAGQRRTGSARRQP